MKSRPVIPFIIIAGVVIILTAGFFYLRQFIPKYQWGETLHKNSEQPYGTSILYNLLKASYPEEGFSELTTPDFETMFEGKTNATYVFVGSTYFVDSLLALQLLEFADNGNTVFIASSRQIEKFISFWLSGSDFPGICEKPLLRDSVVTSFVDEENIHTGKDYSFYYQFLKSTRPYPWQYFDSTFFRSFPGASPVIESTIDSTRANIIRIPFGKGEVYLCSTPLFLTNYHLVREEGYEYLESLFAKLLREKVIWDSYSIWPFQNPSYPQLRESPLRFILSHKSFRWAWYMLLVSIIIFVAIQSKRRLAPIPLQTRKENNTLDYARAIGQLYFQAKNHSFIATEIMNQLSSYVRIRYSIKIGKERSESIGKLQKASGISRKKLEEIFALERKLKYSGDGQSSELYQLYNHVNEFYKNSK